MAFIGAKPTNVPLTSADLEDSIITSAKIVDGTISSSDIDLTDNYDFTGTVTGAGETLKPTFFARKVGSSDQSIGGNTVTKITFDNELTDTNSNFASNTFTPTTSGTYFFTYQLSGTPNGSNMEDYYLYLYKNGSNIGLWSTNSKGGGSGADLQDGQDNSLNMTYIDTANGTGDYYEIYGKFSEPFIVNYAHFGAFKLF